MRKMIGFKRSLPGGELATGEPTWCGKVGASSCSSSWLSYCIKL